MGFPISVGDIVETRLRARLNEQQLLNVWHYRVSSGSSFDGAVDLAAAIGVLTLGAESFLEYYRDLASQDVLFESIEMQLIYPTRYLTVSIAQNVFGEKIGTALPQNVQASFTKRVGTVGRSVNGRAEVFGMTTDDVNEGRLAVTTIGEVSAIGSAMKATITIPDSTVVLSSIVYRRSNPLLSQPIESIRVQDSVRVARRRTVGVGR